MKQQLDSHFGIAVLVLIGALFIFSFWFWYDSSQDITDEGSSSQGVIKNQNNTNQQAGENVDANLDDEDAATVNELLIEDESDDFEAGEIGLDDFEYEEIDFSAEGL